jgi:hypothetical protein
VAGVACRLGYGRDVFYLTGGSARSSLFAVAFGRRKGQVHNYFGGVGKDMENPVDQVVLLWYNGIAPTHLVDSYKTPGDCRSSRRGLTAGISVSNQP